MPDRFIGRTILRIHNLKSGNIYVIVHGQKDLLEGVKSELILRGFKEENILMAKLDEAGNTGDYVAMVWPPGKPREIIVSQIVENKQSQDKSLAPGAWEALQQNELYRIPLKDSAIV
jgi:hypothetical protein